MEFMTRIIIVGLAGASGVIYGMRFLSLLKEKGIETHLIISEAGKKDIEIETHYNAYEVASLRPTWR